MSSGPFATPALAAAQPPAFSKRNHSARAFEEVFAEHLDALFRTALRLCRGNEADAEDLLQDSALRAYTSFEQLRDSSAARAWPWTSH